MDYTGLKSEITVDPDDIGYAPYVTSGSDQKIADLLNAEGAGTISKVRAGKNDFLLGMTPALLRLASGDAALKDKWDRIFRHAQAAESFDITDPRVDSLLTLAVSDGILTSAEKTAIKTRLGSRAEVVFGDGTRVTNEDVSIALRRTA